MNICNTVNYWEPINLKIENKINLVNNNITVIHNSAEVLDIINLLNKINGNNTLLYISFSKTFDSLIKYSSMFKFNIFVIDYISLSLFEKPDQENCIYRNKPVYLSDLFNLIKEYSEKIKPNYIIFDSISDYVNISNEMERKTLNGIMDYINKNNKNNNLKSIILYDTQNNNIVDVPHYTIGDVIKMEIIKK